jgi:hypothetical protein
LISPQLALVKYVSRNFYNSCKEGVFVQDSGNNLPDSIRKTACSGQTEGAHIKPHKKGGSDKLPNGVWLCQRHHRLTEGKLDGKRGLNVFEVKYEE